MSDWTAGYVAELDYTYGYYTELNPQRIELALIDQGIKPPKIENACELGFGQGLRDGLNNSPQTMANSH